MAMQEPYSAGVATVTPEASTPNDYLSSSAATPDAFGGGLAQGTERLGQGAVTSAQFFGRVAADDASNQFQDFATKLLHGDPSKTVTGPDGQPMPDTGYLGLRGRAALDHRQSTEQALDDQLKELRANLQSPEQQLEFDNFTRRYRAMVSERIGTHADGQSTVWYNSVNTASAKLAMDHISNNFDNDEEVKHGTADLASAYIKNAQLAGAGPNDPQIKEAYTAALRDSLQARLNAMAVKDPSRAMAILDKNKDIAGIKYDDMARSFRARADQQRGTDIGSQALRDTYTTQPAAPAQAARLTEIGARYGISGAFLQRTQQMETGNNPNQTSSTGAKGPFQFIDSTAKRVGVKDPFNWEEAADGAARLAAMNRDELTARLGRPPTDAELYLSHNQGAAGAALLLSHPNTPAGQLVGDVAIRVNGGDPNAPASAFTSMMTNKWNAAPAQAHADRKAAAFQTIMSIPDSDIDPQVRQHALTFVSQQVQAQQIAEEQDQKARKQAAEQAQSDLVTKIISGSSPSIIAEIANNPNLDGPQKENLYNFAVQKGGIADTLEYGPGYTQAFKAITAPSDDPSKITDVASIIRRAGPGGDLTMKGASQLIGVMDKIRKQPDQAGISTVKAKQLEYYQNKFALSQNDLGGFLKPFKNQKGLDRFNHDFVPAFEAAYSDWVAKGKDPMEFLQNNKMLDEMMNRIYPADQRARDTLQGGDVGKAPPAPSGVDQKAWDQVVNSPPKGKNKDGQDITPADWAKPVEWLRNNPTAENKAKFDRTFGASGYTADYVLRRLPPTPFEAGFPEPEAPPAPPSKPILERIPQTLLPPSLRTGAAAEAQRKKDEAEERENERLVAEGRENIH